MSFFAKVEAAFKKFFSKAPSILQKSSSVLSFTAPILKRILTQVDPNDAPAVSNVIAEVETTIANTSATIADAHNSADKTTLAHISTGIDAVATHLIDLLAAGHIKDATVKADVTLAVEEAQAVVKQLSA